MRGAEEAAGPSTHMAQLRVRGSQLKSCSRITPNTAEHRNDTQINATVKKNRSWTGQMQTVCRMAGESCLWS